MEQLLKETTAYKILSGDRLSKKLSHAYMLYFPDVKNLEKALKIFALEFFGERAGSQKGSRILSGSYTDFKLYPTGGEKISAGGVNSLIADSALRPVEGDRKLYAVCGFDSAPVLLQNKFLKTLEEPTEGVHFLLGVTSLSPVIDTVRSRVKLLEVLPFSPKQIFSALERRKKSELNALAAQNANGILGEAENLVDGGWYSSVRAAAVEICAVRDNEEIGEVAAKYSEIGYKQELLSEMQHIYFAALTKGEGAAVGLSKSALICALEKIDSANADLKFNANFYALLYDFLLCVAQAQTRSALKN